MGRRKMEKRKRIANIEIPIWVIKLKEQHRTWQQLIDYGLYVVQSKYESQIESIRSLVNQIRFSEVQDVRDYVIDFSVMIDTLVGSTKKLSISVEEETYNKINSIGALLGITTSSMVRLCVYHSILTEIHEEIPNEIKERIKRETEIFRDKIEARENVLSTLKNVSK